MSDYVEIDLSNYKDRTGSRVLPGTYSVLVEDADQDVSRQNNPMINLTLRIIDDETFDGATLVDRLTITEKAMFRVVAFMQAVGLPTPRKKFQLNTRTLIGRTLDVEVADGEPYNGRVKSEVRSYMRRVGGASAAGAAASGLTDLEDLASLSEVSSSSFTDVLARTSSAVEEDDEIDLDKVDLG